MKKHLGIIWVIVIVLFLGYHIFQGGPCLCANESSQELVVGLHISAWTLFDYDWAEKPPEHHEWSGEASHPDWKENVRRNLDRVKNRGYDVVLLDVMATDEGAYFFTCPVLKETGYRYYFDVVGFITKEAHRRDMKLFAEHTVLLTH